ncbi:MAG TPA: PQQ-binding-like beta-propeller repeat protein [Vicinamibacterales bacterium]|nr:PQQ-binding-like beta-propeller repeat protein [Vicinamibacterales bacterium]
MLKKHFDRCRAKPVAERPASGVQVIARLTPSRDVVLRAAVVCLGLCAAPAAQVRVPDQALISPDAKDWVTYGGSYTSQRFSQLKQVTTANASRLEAKWVYHLAGAKELEPTPIVANGVMYISAFNRVDALDARTGNIIWTHQRQPPSVASQRGAAIYGDKVYMATSDSHLVALDARTGGVRWDVKAEGGFTISGGAPLVADGKVIVCGNRPHGFIQAYDAERGTYVWSWSSVPTRPEDPAYATWGGGTPAGAPIWVSGSYDPDLNLIYYGTGQPDPQWTGVARPGDNLYSDSIVALDVKTGTLKWHFQNTPHDVHDWDSLETPVLVDATFRGQSRKLLLQANRNGFYYILDRDTGEFLQGTPFVDKLDWATGLDARGRPIVAPGHEPTVTGTSTCPSTAGATNWPPPTYSRDTGYLYVVVAEGCGINVIRSSTVADSATGYYESSRAPWQAYVRAIDVLTGKRIWEYKAIRSNHYGPGLLSTAGGIVFAPEQLGQVSVLDAKTGKSLWHFNTGDVITAAPVTYSVDGEQFFAIASGTNVFAFGLFDGR